MVKSVERTRPRIRVSRNPVCPSPVPRPAAQDQRNLTRPHSGPRGFCNSSQHSRRTTRLIRASDPTWVKQELPDQC